MPEERGQRKKGWLEVAGLAQGPGCVDLWHEIFFLLKEIINIVELATISLLDFVALVGLFIFFSLNLRVSPESQVCDSE